jgi:putative flippase GtrA
VSSYQPMFLQFCRFAAVGLCGTAVQYLTLWIGVKALHTSPVWASAVGYLLGSVCNYALNYLITFRATHGHVKTAPRYFALLAVGWCLNNLLMLVFTHNLGWPIWIAQVITTGIGLFWNFCGSRWWAFKAQAAGA